MNDLSSEPMKLRLKSIRKVILWMAVCILIGELVVGVILVLAQSFNEAIGKLMGTFALCALALFVSVNNFSVIEKGKSAAQGFAIVGLISNVTWLLFAILLIWGFVPFMEMTGTGFIKSELSIFARLLIVSVDIALVCFCVSNVLMIEETLKPVKPLKITAIVCVMYCGIYAMIVSITGFSFNSDPRWYILYSIGMLGFIVMTIAASTISKSGKKRQKENVNINTEILNDDAVQAKIQEMVEKEVQARIAVQNVQSTEIAPAPTIIKKPEMTQEPKLEQTTGVEQKPENLQDTQITGLNTGANQ